MSVTFNIRKTVKCSKLQNNLLHKSMTISMTAAIVLSALATSACSTKPDFRPTASVMVGGHKSI